MKLVCVVGPTGCGKTWLGRRACENARRRGRFPATRCRSTAAWHRYRRADGGGGARAFRINMLGRRPTRGKTTPLPAMRTTRRSASTISSRAGSSPSSSAARGLYLNALLAGHGFAGGDKDGRYRAELESRWDKEGGEAMFAELRRIDPETAGNLHLNDKKRILRALEVYYETGQDHGTAQRGDETHPPALRFRAHRPCL